MRRLAFAVATLIGSLAFVTSTAAASATSWRAHIIGEHLHGGATTIITSDNRGSISVKLYGVPAGQPVVVSVNPGPCPTQAQSLFSFLTGEASTGGIATGKLQLTPGQIKAYNAALSARTRLSLLVVTRGDNGCGDQAGTPSVGTARLRGSAAHVYDYDLRYPVVSGIDAAAAALVNATLGDAANATVAAFVADATRASSPSIGDPSRAAQTFSVTLAQPGLLSLIEHYIPEVIGAPHGDEQFFTFTFDLATGHRVHLAGLFRPGTRYIDVLARESRKRLRALIGPFADALTGPLADNFQSWFLVPSGLRITFSQAQGFAVPISSITIPWQALRPILDPHSPIARLVPPA